MRTKKGVVTSAKMTGTVTVTVHSHAFHPIYKKRYRKSKKFLADANKLDLYAGDEVVIEECRPLSKRKYFKVKEITKAAARVSDIAEESAIEEVVHREKEGDMGKGKGEEGAVLTDAKHQKNDETESDESSDNPKSENPSPESPVPNPQS